MNFKQWSPTRWFWTFVLAEMLLWFLLPTVVRHVTPMDSTEGAMWGQYLTWGYTRDPWLNAWLTRLALTISNNHDWSIYLFSQLAVGAAFWSVWRLGKIILSPWLALIAVLVLFGLQYYNIAAVDFNDNVCEIALWPLMALYLYRACTTNRLKHWILLGIFSGLGLMAKYYTALPLLAMLIFMLSTPTGRACFKSKGVYIALLVFSVVIAPHFIWLPHHDYITLTYSFGKVDNHASFLERHIGYALHFFFAQLFTFLGACVLFAFVVMGKKGKSDWLGSPSFDLSCGFINQKKKLNAFDQNFLWIVGFGPFVLTLLASIAFGWKLNTMWGTPIQSLWGLVVVAMIQPYLTCAKLERFLIAVAVVTLLIGLGYTLSLTKRGSHSSANFPVREIAAKMTADWYQRYQTKLSYVAGPNKAVSYMARYSKDRPQALIGWDSTWSPWVNMKDFREKGAAFILMTKDSPDPRAGFPEYLLERYPNLIVLPVSKVSWLRAKPGQAPFYYRFAFLPPNNQKITGNNNENCYCSSSI
ncbi:glycosyltransferase family 39 protein [Piscirickettsia litoralis]|uniref:Dolichyl-phosphate-mannose-protein mannosyltransferase n=1 Tax=Piscirickettsia litoralis TaxID=1891921 RepID=A0ABX3A1B5_9GAMM|nr:glycosyltransferase family 39 protein [Piscirickettsia litoralis]ODN42662.1 dolichyl-phosphate-mannose-protein mannosyltransferase [Piscirickettsia litoralis]